MPKKSKCEAEMFFISLRTVFCNIEFFLKINNQVVNCFKEIIVHNEKDKGSVVHLIKLLITHMTVFFVTYF